MSLLPSLFQRCKEYWSRMDPDERYRLLRVLACEICATRPKWDDTPISYFTKTDDFGRLPEELQLQLADGIHPLAKRFSIGAMIERRNARIALPAPKGRPNIQTRLRGRET